MRSKTGSYSPCKMELAGDTPNWAGCGFNIEKNRREINRCLEKMRVFPQEFRPPKNKPWDGISLEFWMGYINGRDH